MVLILLVSYVCFQYYMWGLCVCQCLHGSMFLSFYSLFVWARSLCHLLRSASWACVHVLGVVVEGECSCCGVFLLGFLICRWWEICEIYDVITCYFEVGLWVLWNRIKLLLHWVRLDATCCFQCKVAWITLYSCPLIQLCKMNLI